MLPSKCTHIRIRDNNDYDTDVDHFIKTIQKEYKIDFRSLPEWEKLVQRLHVATTDCKRKIQDANLRKSMIIDKLLIQSTRPSPFELTAGLCRTASKWRRIENERNKRKICVTGQQETSATNVLEDEDTFPNTPHPTEIHTSESPFPDIEPELSKVNVVVQAELPAEPSHLPVLLVTNPHKLVSPLGSRFSGLSYTSLFSATEALLDSEVDEWILFKPTSQVVCTPTQITLTNDTLKQQFVQFSVTNCGGEYLHIRFKRVMDDYNFLKTKLYPVIPKRLYPGVPVVFKLIFTLKNQEEFKSGLYFKVGRDVYDDAPPEAFIVPITSAFTISRSVIVPVTITIPPVYLWHIKRNDIYPNATVKISVNDPYSYHLHIYKRTIDLSKESNILLALTASKPNTETIAEINTDEMDAKTIASLPIIYKSLLSKMDAKSLTSTAKAQLPAEKTQLPTAKAEKKGEKSDAKSVAKSEKNAESENDENENELFITTEIMASIAKDMIERALDTFLFESTYLYLQPYSKVTIPVYFTKAEYIGCHQNYFILELVDPETDNVVFTKVLKVYAEVLPHPIQIHPSILDMSKSPVSHGYCEDIFVVSNTHKLYPVTVHIKLSTKMKKLFFVKPMKAVVPESTSVPFTVKFCSRDFMSAKPSKDLVHFTFKVIVTGYKAVYENVPPLFYEVVAPCAEEFKKVYNEKYFKDE